MGLLASNSGGLLTFVTWPSTIAQRQSNCMEEMECLPGNEHNESVVSRSKNKEENKS